MDSSTTMILHETLEFMYNTKDADELTNIFTSLGVYLLSKDTSKEIVIKSEQLYEKIFLLLNRSQKKKVIALDLIFALFISIDDDDPSRIFIQNMIRISGCLKAISNLFTVVLQKNTSFALCRSLSEVCRGSSPNQWFCTHLVPICIKKCHQHSEMFSVLQSLLFKHHHNTRLFHQCQGMTIFTSDSLENEDCLQLLNIVVENTEGEERESIQKASYLFDHLQYLLRSNDSSSMISKWASIILYSYCKYYMMIQDEGEVRNEFDNKTHNNSNEDDTNPMIINDAQRELFSNETNVLFKNIINEIVISKKHEKMGKDQQRQFQAIQKNSCENFFNEHVTELNQSPSHATIKELAPLCPKSGTFTRYGKQENFSTDADEGTQFDNTQKKYCCNIKNEHTRGLYGFTRQNSIREYAATEGNQRSFSSFPENIKFTQKKQEKSNSISRTQIESRQKYSYFQPTFTFQNNHTRLDRFATNNSIQESAPPECRNERSFSIIHKNISKINFKSASTCENVLDDSIFLHNRKQKNEDNSHNCSIHNETIMNEAAEFVIDFSPRRCSTPFINSVDKYKSINSSTDFVLQNSNQYINTRKNKSFAVPSSVSRTTLRSSKDKKLYDTVKSKINKTKRNETLTKSLRNKSITFRILDVVNLSCTAIAKSYNTLKNIFKTDNKEESIESPSSEHSKSLCNYSFTNYMRERDKEREKEERKDDNLETSSCNTCDNTIAANQKLVNDYNLQRTVNLLKRGINLYGCDFKKISKTMWPRDKSMTPKVLYKLYRKLIMK